MQRFYLFTVSLCVCVCVCVCLCDCVEWSLSSPRAWHASLAEANQCSNAGHGGYTEEGGDGDSWRKGEWRYLILAVSSFSPSMCGVTGVHQLTACGLNCRVAVRGDQTNGRGVRREGQCSCALQHHSGTATAQSTCLCTCICCTPPLPPLPPSPPLPPLPFPPSSPLPSLLSPPLPSELAWCLLMEGPSWVLRPTREEQQPCRSR